MLEEKEAVIKRISILMDGLLVIVSYFFAYFFRQYFHSIYKLNIIKSTQIIGSSSNPLSNYLTVLFIVVPLWLGMFYFNGMYRSVNTKTVLEFIWITLKSSIFATFFFGMIVFLGKLGFISRLFFIFFIIITIILISFEKIAFSYIIHNKLIKRNNNKRVLVVGKGKRAAEFIRKVNNHPEWAIRIIGAIDDEPERKIISFENVNIIGSIDDLPQILHNQVVDEVVFIVPRSRLNYIENAIYACEIEGIKVNIVVDLFDLKIARARPTEIDGIPLLTLETSVATEWELFIKRFIDIIISGLAIILLSPIFFLVSILIKLTSPGPILFTQKRIGLNGRRFILYKFRTMYVGAHRKLANVNVFKEMDDPDFRKKKVQYMTPLGKILRKFSIDELPQLFNIFIGHMSLIGPRPSVPEEVKQYEPWQRRRLSMRPGLTCLWQISGRNKLDFDEWMKLDLKYLDNWSLWLDFKILIRTIPVVILGIGAY
ncbi:MAG: sugar transferase [Candidatus Helarchaeota archaeon]